MSMERGKLTVPSDTSRAQSRATDPSHSIWVEANAGSGKTFVLTRRVLRLLLAGVRPESILCLTYTKAAAAEMRKRVSQQLAEWAVLEEAKLREKLTDLLGTPPDAAGLHVARTLFARALETPGGLRILTIHAFCEAVLHRFPIEAGVPFDFSVIEEDQQTQLILAARESVLAEGLRGHANGAAVETLFHLLSDHHITEAIGAALSKGARLKPLLADPEGAKARLRRLVGLSNVSAVELIESTVRDTLLTPNVLRHLVSTLGGNPEGNRKCVDLLARIDPEQPDREKLYAAFFTGKDEPRTGLLTKAQQTAYPHFFELLTAEQDRFVALETAIRAAQLVERSNAVLDILAAIAKRYEDQKRRRALLDFDDLVDRLGDLLDNLEIGPWVQYKLDAGIEHILVDESQDTNDQQWRVVRALAAEFFVGEGAARRPRSVFAVGDQKQSIYSFQGAQPALFGTTGYDFARRAEAAEMPIRCYTPQPAASRAARSPFGRLSRRKSPRSGMANGRLSPWKQNRAPRGRSPCALPARSKAGSTPGARWPNAAAPSRPMTFSFSSSPAVRCSRRSFAPCASAACLPPAPTGSRSPATSPCSISWR
jgi:ATP-dependent helicase/nuclease subunit A